MDLNRNSVRQWLNEAITQRGDTPTALARAAGVSQSTLTRFLGNDDGTMLSLRTLAKLVHVIGGAPPGFDTTPVTNTAGTPAPVTGFREPEGEPLQGGAHIDEPIRRAIAALVEGRNAADVWVLKTIALRGIGYLPGDLVVVDLNVQPRAGDVVCAQVYQWAKGTAETIFRIYQPPYLVAASDDPAHRRPLVVDENNIIIKGVITQLLR